MKKFMKIFYCMNLVRHQNKPVQKFLLQTFCSSFKNIKGSEINCNLSKNLFSTSVNHKNSKTETNEKSGKIIKDDEVIYYGKLTPQIKGLKVFTCCSSLGGFFVQAIIIQNILTGENLSLNLGLGSAVGFFTFVTPFLIHSLTKKYVTEIKYNSLKKTYEAITLSFFLRQVKNNFKIEDIKIPDSLPIFTTMCIKGKPVFVVSESFLDINHYIKMMGYDKPIDLKLNVPNNKFENDGIQR